MRPGDGQPSEFDHLRQPSDGKCWWCGAVADSREHRFKQTDLAMLEARDGQLTWGGSNSRNHDIRSVKKSDAVRFDKSLCVNCNGSRSQPFDRAYAEYSEFLWQHADEMWYWDALPMGQVFGAGWTTKQLDLARYFAKHFGCRIADNGFTPPRALIDFMNGRNQAPGFRVCFLKQEDLWLFHQLDTSDKEGFSMLNNGAVYAEQSEDGSRLTQIQTNTLAGYIGVDLFWSEFDLEMDSFFPHEFPVLNENCASDAVLQELERIAQD